jgi:hypothetical protein
VALQGRRKCFVCRGWVVRVLGGGREGLGRCLVRLRPVSLFVHVETSTASLPYIDSIVNIIRTYLPRVPFAVFSPTSEEGVVGQKPHSLWEAARRAAPDSFYGMAQGRSDIEQETSSRLSTAAATSFAMALRYGRRQARRPGQWSIPV